MTRTMRGMLTLLCEYMSTITYCALAIASCVFILESVYASEYYRLWLWVPTLIWCIAGQVTHDFFVTPALNDYHDNNFKAIAAENKEDSDG